MIEDSCDWGHIVEQVDWCLDESLQDFGEEVLLQFQDQVVSEEVTTCVEAKHKQTHCKVGVNQIKCGILLLLTILLCPLSLVFLAKVLNLNFDQHANNQGKLNLGASSVIEKELVGRAVNSFDILHLVSLHSKLAVLLRVVVVVVFNLRGWLSLLLACSLIFSCIHSLFASLGVVGQDLGEVACVLEFIECTEA
jgi:hypothetical protein